MTDALTYFDCAHKTQVSRQLVLVDIHIGNSAFALTREHCPLKIKMKSSCVCAQLIFLNPQIKIETTKINETKQAKKPHQCMFLNYCYSF